MAGGTLRDWKQTVLWKLIAERAEHGDQVRVAVEQYMPTIQAVIEQGGTASPDMTLHDAQHSARVADRMVEIVPAATLHELSVLELSMLLFSAYLHDIGMTPERQQRVALYDYLLTGDTSATTEVVRTEFKLWVEDRYAGTAVPMVRGEPLTSHDLRFADEVTDYYVRHKHNEWSATWIRKHMANPQKAPFAGWEEVLIDLAQSHHWGRTELEGPKLKPQMISEQMLNLRYLACVLRIADILEADPARSTPILFEHRQPVEASRIYWQKDHGLSVNIVRSDSGAQRVVVFARPSSAHAHHEILKYVAGIESELSTCRFISDQHPFTHLPGVDRALQYAWNLSESVSLTISGDLSYEYIDGTFRADTRRLLELVSGSSLYGSELAAVRELLQNAFDAVKEQIAYERLNASDPADEQTEETIAARLKVTLTMHEYDGRWYLTCEDRGVGMTKAIIESHFLISGSRRPRSTIALEERARARNIVVGRTGEFGIGALSYFLIADQLLLETRRSLEPGDDHGESGWQFQIDDLDAFGELRTFRRNVAGTSIRLRLKSEIIGNDPEAWSQKLLDYLRQILNRIPCTFEVELHSGARQVFKRGWTKTEQQLRQSILRSLDHTFEVGKYTRLLIQSSGLLTAASQPLVDAANKQHARFREVAEASLRFDRYEGGLAGNVGRYCAFVPYFDMGHGPMLILTSLVASTTSVGLDEGVVGQVWLPSGVLYNAWKGMKASVERTDKTSISFDDSKTFSGAIVLIDWFSSAAARIRLSRESVTLSEPALNAVALLQQFVDERRADLARRGDEVVRRMSEVVLPSAKEATQFFWPIATHAEENMVCPLREVTYPLTSEAYLPNHADRNVMASYDGRAVALLQSLKEVGGSFDDRLWWHANSAPTRILLLKSNDKTNIPIPIWSGSGSATKMPLSAAIPFPPDWGFVVGVSDRAIKRTYVNASNCLVRLATPEAEDVMRSVSGLEMALTRFEKKPERVAAWLLMNFRSVMKPSELWNALVYNDPEIASIVWDALRDLDAELTEFRYYLIGDHGSSGYRFAKTGASNFDPPKYPELPDPGIEWTLSVNIGRNAGILPVNPENTSSG